MKWNLGTLFLCLSLGMGLMGCKQNTPEARAERFLNSLYRMDYQEAKAMATEETGKVLDMMEQFSSMMPDSVRENAKRIRIDIQGVEEEGDRATVTYMTTESEHENTLDMIRQDGEWFAQWDKSGGDDLLDLEVDSEETPPVTTPEEEVGAE